MRASSVKQECIQEDAIYAINANAAKIVHEVNCAIAIASFMNGTSVALALLRLLSSKVFFFRLRLALDYAFQYFTQSILQSIYWKTKQVRVKPAA